MPELRLVEPTRVPPGDQFSNEEAQALRRAVINLFNLWEIGDEQAAILLGGIAPRTYQRWKAGDAGRISPDQSARMSNLIGIHKALRLIFKEKNRVYGWVKRPNEVFGGLSALEIMLGGQLTDVMRVRRYLDTVRGQW